MSVRFSACMDVFIDAVAHITHNQQYFVFQVSVKHAYLSHYSVNLPGCMDLYKHASYLYITALFLFIAVELYYTYAIYENFF